MNVTLARPRLEWMEPRAGSADLRQDAVGEFPEVDFSKGGGGAGEGAVALGVVVPVLLGGEDFVAAQLGRGRVVRGAVATASSAKCRAAVCSPCRRASTKRPCRPRTRVSVSADNASKASRAEAPSPEICAACAESSRTSGSFPSRDFDSCAARRAPLASPDPTAIMPRVSAR